MKIVAVLVASFLVASVAHAAVADRLSDQASPARSAPELLLVRQAANDTSTCSCECVAATDFDADACSSSGTCTAMPCPMDDGKTGKTCCSASDTVDADSDTDAASGGVRTVARDAKLTPSSRGYSCRYYYRYRCLCRYYRIGRRVYRRCYCYRIRYRRCRYY